MKIMLIILMLGLLIFVIKLWWMEREWQLYIKENAPRYKPYAQGLAEVEARARARRQIKEQGWFTIAGHDCQPGCWCGKGGKKK